MFSDDDLQYMWELLRKDWQKKAIRIPLDLETELNLYDIEALRQMLVFLEVALDVAIMTCNATKLQEINKIVRDLWSNMYSGNDVDYIEITTNEKEATTFSYQVVMIHKGVAQNMIGRCSAGQKALASLVIRLALAETYCLSCTVLALDEPTTNLDRDSIKFISDALLKLIDSRSNQNHFQLIVITHDKCFAKACHSDTAVYMVSKNPARFSQIKLVTVFSRKALVQ